MINKFNLNRFIALVRKSGLTILLGNTPGGVGMVFLDENQEKLLEYFEGSSELFDPGKTSGIEVFKVSKRRNILFWIKIN